MTYISGFHAIEETMKSGARCSLLSGKPGPRAREIVALAVKRGVRVDRTGTAELDRLAPGHRGIVLAVEEGRAGDGAFASPPSVESFLAEINLAEKSDALAVVLDEVTDPHNYGAILRSCDQFGADLVVCRRRRNAKNAAVVAQTSSGASAWVPQAEEANLARALDLLKENGFWLYAADMDGAPAWELDLTGRAALVIGGEAGLTRLLKEKCDAAVALPSEGRLDSLNVSVAAGALLYEARRQRAAKSKSTKKKKGPSSLSIGRAGDAD